jgi:hypothetical protein
MAQNPNDGCTYLFFWLCHLNLIYENGTLYDNTAGIGQMRHYIAHQSSDTSPFG